MGITKDFFTKPIPVSVTLVNRSTNEAGEVETEETVILFTMNRETAGTRKGLEVAATLFDDANNLARFCKQLAEEPQGIDDFPKEGGTLEQRALDYFTDSGYESVIQYVVMEVERAQKPLEFFRRV
jgi:hypothetical protein